MKKLFSMLSVILLLLSVCTACQSSKGNIRYVLEYKIPQSETIETLQKEGNFFVLEEPIKTEWANGTIEIDSCYYDGYWGLNLYAYVETNDPEELEALANDEQRSLYCTVKVNGRQLELSSYGYSLKRENKENNTTRYKLSMGYYCSAKSIKQPLEVEFSGVKMEVPMVKKQGVPMTSPEGVSLIEKYQPK